MSVTIRKNKKEDNVILAKIIRSSFHDFDVKNTCGTVYTDPTTDDLFSLFQVENSALYVAEENGVILGCCGIFPTENLPEKNSRTGEILSYKRSQRKRNRKIINGKMS